MTLVARSGPFARFGPACGLFALMVAAWIGCSPKRNDPTPVASSTASADPLDASAQPEKHVVIDPVEQSTGCTLGHDGVVLDLGEASARADLAIREPTETIEREGATWERVTNKTLTMRFVPASEGVSLATSDGGKSDVYVDAHVRSLLAKSATVYLNGKAVGTWQLSKGESKIVSAHSSVASIASGQNQLSVRFNGVPKGSTNDAIAEIDWIRIGPQTESSYAATTRGDAVVTQTIAGSAKRSISLPAPGFLRCVAFLPRGSTVELSVAAAGKGDADIVVRAIKDRAPAKDLATLHATDASWQFVTLAVPEDMTNTIAAIEITVLRATRGVRALLGGVRVTTPPLAAQAARKPARNALVVVLGQTPPLLLSTYGGKIAMPTLDALAKDGLVFDHHRASTSWAGGSFASLLTGLLAPQHGAQDEATRLSSEPVTIARATRDAGIQSALFTANPTTSAAYGFDRDWVDFESTLPTTDSSTRVFDDAAQWIGKHTADRFLLVVHARGGHPPWDATGEELKSLAPDAYAGSIEPRHAGEILGKARRVPPQVRFGDADRARAWALFELQMRAHDAALAKLMQALHDAGHDADTAVIVTGDAGTSASSRVPFGDEAALDETTLAIPLVVRLPPSSGPAAAHVSAMTTSIDLARSILSTLGLSAPQAFGGVDVVDLAVEPLLVRPVVATAPRGKLSLREGSLVLFGNADHQQLCDLDLDAACATDASSTYPLAEIRLRSDLASVFQTPAVKSTAMVPDPGLAAALRAWGR